MAISLLTVQRRNHTWKASFRKQDQFMSIAYFHQFIREINTIIPLDLNCEDSAEVANMEVPTMKFYKDGFKLHRRGKKNLFNWTFNEQNCHRRGTCRRQTDTSNENADAKRSADVSVRVRRYLSRALSWHNLTFRMSEPTLPNSLRHGGVSSRDDARVFQEQT